MVRWVFPFVGLVGCDFTRANDFGQPPSPPGDPGPDTTTTSPTADDTGAATFDCADVWAESVASQLVEGDTTDRPDRYRSSCRGEDQVEDGPETVIGFTVPSAGTWEFDLVDPPGNDFDTVLAVLDGCDGEELGCNDDFDPVIRRSRVTLTLDEGQTVLVQVDGFLETDRGPFTLSIEAL